MIQSIDYSERLVAGLLILWQGRLGLTAFRAAITPVDPMQVTGEDGLPGAELVGVVIESRRFTILHTRPLDESDIVHELLHVAYPEWPHDRVELWTERLLAISAHPEALERRTRPLYL